MSSNKYIILFAISAVIVSCASNKEFIFGERESKDLVTELNIKKDTFKKFKTAELSDDDKEKLSQQLQAKRESSKKIISRATARLIHKKNKKPKLNKIIVSEKPQIVKIGREYASDYPELYKKYDENSLKTWNKFSPHFFDNEEFTMSISYLGITAGHIRLKTKPRVKIGGKTAYHFQGILKSAKFYNYIYSLDDSIDTFLDTEDFLPIKYSMIQRESGQDVDDLQLFDGDKNKTYFWYNKLKKGKRTKREKEAYIPHYFQDSFSALYFVRGLPLKINDVYEFPIVTRAKIWTMKMKVEKIETIEVMGKDISALRINAVTRFPGVLKKKGDIIFWYSNDKYRKLLKFEAKVKIGSIEGELLNYTRGDRRISSIKHDKSVKDKKLNAKHL